MEKDSNTKYFKFATTGNPNIRSCDCVVRSISLALHRTWNEVFDDLCDIARIKKRMPNETIIYQEYLKKNAFTKFSCPKKSNNKKKELLSYTTTWEIGRASCRERVSSPV